MTLAPMILQMIAPTIEIGEEERLNGIQAAERAGIEIPHYCWHPALSVVGSCRMCLVEVGSRDPKTGEIFVSAVWTHGKPGTHQWVGNGSEPGLAPERPDCLDRRIRAVRVDLLGRRVEDVEALANWEAAAPAKVEIPYKPARVVLQDFTGVPAVVDLAAIGITSLTL